MLLKALERIPLGLAGPRFHAHFMLIKNKKILFSLLGKTVVSLMVLPSRHMHLKFFQRL